MALVTQNIVQAVQSLRPYQQECVKKSLDMLLKENVKRQLVSLPVGSGKTTVFASLLGQVPSPKPMADKTLVLAHREELINQASLRISKINPHLVVDVDQGDRKASQSADVIVASIPTLGRMGSKRLEGYNPDAYKTIIVDEAHHATAESYRRTLNHFGAIDPNSHILLWGCTATPRRFDGTALDAVFQKIIFHRDLVEMMRSGYLCRVRVTTILTKTDASQVTSSKAAATNDRDFVISKLSEAIDTDERNNMIADAYVQKIQAERKSTLVFACDVKHIHNIVDSFRSRGVDADCVHGETPREERAAVLKRFLEGSLPVLVNCGVLSEGTDIPNIDCIIMARPTRSSLLFQQMVGRGLRTFPGKENCLVIDCVDDFKGKKVKLVTTPTLFGFPIPEGSVLSEADMLDLMDNMLKRKDLKKRAEELAERLAQDDIDDTGDDTSDDDLDLDGNANWYGPKLQHPAKNPVVGLVQYDLEELDPWHNEDEIIHRASSSTPVKTKHLFDSQFAWTAVTRGVDYVLSGMAKEKIDYRVVQEGGPNKFSLYQKQTFKDESTKIILHCEGESLQTAISTVEAKVGRQCKPHERANLYRSAKWRRGPATEAQLRLLNERKVQHDEDITRGNAAYIITKLFASHSWEKGRMQAKADFEKRKKSAS